MRVLFFLLALLVAGPASAQLALTGAGCSPGLCAAGVTYKGIADYETTIVHCWALNACSAAAATANSAAVTITNNSGTTCTGIKVLSTGTLDVSSGTTYCTGSVTVTSACSTNCVVGGTFRITQLYDQVGSANHACTYASAPEFILSGYGSKPTYHFQQSRSTQCSATITAIVTATNGMSLGFTFSQVANFSTFAFYGGPSITSGTLEHNTTNTLGIYINSAQITIAAADGSGTTDFTTCHNAVFTIVSGLTTGAWSLDGATTAESGFTSATTGTTNYIGDFSFGNYSDMFGTRFWLDANSISSTVGNNATSKTNIPCGV